MGKWLYKKNNNEKPCCWRADYNKDYNVIIVQYGIVGKTIRQESYKVVQKSVENEIKSRYNDKRKQGYFYLDEIKDDSSIMIPPSDDDIDSRQLLDYLNTYLTPYVFNQNNNNILPMLAKSYTGNVWKKETIMLGQWKINGLRCIVTAYKTNDIFTPIRLRFQSREGLVWDKLNSLEYYLLNHLSTDILEKMVYEDWALDGEVYLPGYSINEINSFVKNDTLAENKFLQFWCYDLAIQDMKQEEREDIRLYLISSPTYFNSYDEHLNNKRLFITLPSFQITNDEQAITKRNKFIDLGFEGLILRNPNADYQYGRRRVGYMEKFKLRTDGKFKIIAIDKEQKRDLPIITCKNDINDETFETRFSYSHSIQKDILDNKEKYIGREVFIKFGERSGVTNVPFHITEVSLL